MVKNDPSPVSDAAAEQLRRMLDVEPPPRRIAPVLITLIALALAVPLSWAMWHVYMQGTWTRDGTVRVDVDRLAPEVAGRIVALPVQDNQYVHKGELLMQIDPTDYQIAVKLAEAVVRQDQATLANLGSEAARRRKSDDTASLAAAALQQAQARLELAQVNLARTQIRAPVNGWVTNLQAQLGDYANVGIPQLALVDADSFWVDGYFKETSLHAIRVGDPAKVKLLGYRQVLSGHVASIARAIGVPNAQLSQQGLATVNPIFTWVRLAQRVPVRIRLGPVPPGVQLVAGMTATVEVDPAAGG
jgi:multidrug resistance efflux pump